MPEHEESQGSSEIALPISGGKIKKVAKFALNSIGGAIPFAGGVLSAAVAAHSESEQEKVNAIFSQWFQMLKDELHEKEVTIAEIIARLDVSDAETTKRIESDEYQSILKKSFRKWSGFDSQSKRQKIRNILANAAASRLVTDDVVKLFVDWLDTYSDFHFEVVGEIYRKRAVSRGEIWSGLGKSRVREDSAEADLFKLLVRDLSMGGVIRQHRATDYYGNFVKKRAPETKSQSSSTMKSAFDLDEKYELTELGAQFVHYAMNELTAKIEFQEEQQDLT
jgi:hypothetical protein